MKYGKLIPTDESKPGQEVRGKPIILATKYGITHYSYELFRLVSHTHSYTFLVRPFFMQMNILGRG